MKNNIPIQSTILIAGNQGQNQYRIAQLLQEKFPLYNIMTTPNDKIALEIAEKLSPNLMITNWSNVHNDKNRLIKAIRKRNIPILLVMESKSNDYELQPILEAKATAWIHQPIQKDELWTKVVSAIRSFTPLSSSVRPTAPSYEHSKVRSKKQNTTLKTTRAKAPSVKNIPVKTAKKTKLKLSRVFKALAQGTSREDEWSIFRKYFDEVHPNFFTKLQSECPQLTRDDLKHCALVRTYISNKEIAQLFNIHVDSVRTHHYRIKKKLSLPNGTRFSDYIINIAV